MKSASGRKSEKQNGRKDMITPRLETDILILREMHSAEVDVDLSLTYRYINSHT